MKFHEFYSASEINCPPLFASEPERERPANSELPESKN